MIPAMSHPDMKIPYYAVIFTSKRKAREGDGYPEMAAKMDDLARGQPGFLGIESVSSLAEGKAFSVKENILDLMHTFCKRCSSGRPLAGTIRDHNLVLGRRK
jgi:hypothetical protein